MLRHSGSEHHSQKTFSQAQGVEALLAEPGETGPSSAETSHLWVATKAAGTQGTLEVISQGWMKDPVSRVGWKGKLNVWKMNKYYLIPLS